MSWYQVYKPVFSAGRMMHLTSLQAENRIDALEKLEDWRSRINQNTTYYVTGISWNEIAIPTFLTERKR